MSGGGEDGGALVLDGVMAQDETQARAIWAVREMQAVVQSQFCRAGQHYFYDISAPTDKLYDLVESVKARFDHLPHVHVVGFGPWRVGTTRTLLRRWTLRFGRTDPIVSDDVQARSFRSPPRIPQELNVER